MQRLVFSMHSHGFSLKVSQPIRIQIGEKIEYFFSAWYNYLLQYISITLFEPLSLQDTALNSLLL